MLVVRWRDISPDLYLARGEREQPTSLPFFHVPLRLEPITIELLFFHSFVLSLGSNNNSYNLGRMGPRLLHFIRSRKIKKKRKNGRSQILRTRRPRAGIRCYLVRVL